MANNKERQVKEAFEAIHLPEDIAARALESIEAKREQRESERVEGVMATHSYPCTNSLVRQEDEHAEEPLATQEIFYANKIAGQEAKTAEEPFASQASCHASGTSKGQGSATPQIRRKGVHFAKGGRFAAIAACLALVACLIGGFGYFLRPVAYVVIDWNASV